MKWLKGFFENGQPQSMSDGITFIIAVGGLVYAFIFEDFVGGVALIGSAAAIKIHKNHNKKNPL